MIRKTLLAVFMLALSVLFISAKDANALSNQSPNPADMFNITTNPNTADAAEHVMRAHSSGHITKMYFKAYFDSASATPSRSLKLERGARGCHDGPDGIGLTVTIEGQAINKWQACNQGYDTYTIPNNLTYNPDTRKYEANIKLQLYGLDHDKSWYRSSQSRDETFYFLTKVFGDGGIIGPKGDTGSNEFGLIGHRTGYGVKYRMQFGLKCNSEPQSNFGSVVWDPENTYFGPTRMWIEKNPPGPGDWTRLGYNEYGTKHNADWVSGSNYYTSIGNISGDYSFVSVGRALPGTGYRLVIYNPNANGYSNAASSNVYSVTIPSESIYGELDCSTVAKKPKIQIIGSDVRVRGEILTSQTSDGTKLFGSWVEFGALSSGKNDALSSGAGLRNSVVSGTPQANWSKLTFANKTSVNDGVQFGKYGILPTAPQIANYFSSTAGDCSNPLANGEHTCGDVLLSGRNGVNGTVIIKSSGTVTIGGNLIYNNGPYANLSQLPQVVIIAKNIVINENVTRVDAWLVTQGNGTIKTCGNRDVNNPALTDAVCNTQLTITGPVLTDKLYLHRTYGSDGTTDQSKSTPAEIFNLRPDAYLWAYQQGAHALYPTTVSITELPPRF